jgi:hypothetical protein
MPGYDAKLAVNALVESPGRGRHFSIAETVVAPQKTPMRPSDGLCSVAAWH